MQPVFLHWGQQHFWKIEDEYQYKCQYVITLIFKIPPLNQRNIECVLFNSLTIILDLQVCNIRMKLPCYDVILTLIST